MIYFINGLIILASFIAMEGVAWLLHRYVMHGFLWKLHADHHFPHGSSFERNDLFALVFGIPSWLLMMFGIMAGNDFRLYMGIGITLYGLAYVLIHDGLIHQRINLFKDTKNPWLLSLRSGHLAHHQHDHSPSYQKENDVCYGMLWVPLSYLRKVKSDLKQSN